MRISRLVFLAAIACGAFGDPPADPSAEWTKKRDSLYKSAAKEHVVVGKWAASKKLFNEAWPEYTRAAELDPANADAEKGLGRKLDKGAWVDDPKTPSRRGLEASSADVPRLMTELETLRKDLGIRLTKDFAALAEWAKKNALKTEAEGLWKQIIDRYDSENVAARAGLGYRKEGSWWVAPADAARHDEAAKRLRDASAGESVKDATSIELSLGVTHVRRRSAHFLVEGPYSDDQIAELTRILETARDLFLQLVDRKSEDFPGEISAAFFKDQAVYTRYVQTDPSVADENKKAYGTFRGYSANRPSALIICQRDTSWDFVREFAAHLAVHVMLWKSWGSNPIPAWLYEGSAYWVTEHLFPAAAAYCYGFDSNSGVRDGLDIRSWKPEMKRLEREGKDPDFRELFGSNLSSMNTKRSMKAWSLIEWLAGARKKDLQALIAAISAGKDIESAVKESLGVSSLAELEALWEKYVREAY